MENKQDTNNFENSTSSHLAAASGGTLLVVLASKLPDNYSYKPWLILVAPSLTIALNYFWVCFTKEFKRWRKNYTRKKGFKKIIKKLEDDLKNPNITENEKKEILEKIKMYKELQLKAMSEEYEIEF